VFTSLEQASHEHQDPYTNNFNWGNFQEPSCSYNNNHIPLQKSSLEEMMERLETSIKEFQQEVRAGNNMEASTLELIQDECEEQVFEDCSDEEVEYYW